MTLSFQLITGRFCCGSRITTCLMPDGVQSTRVAKDRAQQEPRKTIPIVSRMTPYLECIYSKMK